MRIIFFCVLAPSIFAVSLSNGQSSQKDAITGNGLMGSCQIHVKSLENRSYNETAFEAYRDGYCIGLVSGVSGASPRICADEEVTRGQQVRVVLKYLQEQPEELHLDDTLLVERALSKVFPCRTK